MALAASMQVAFVGCFQRAIPAILVWRLQVVPPLATARCALIMLFAGVFARDLTGRRSTRLGLGQSLIRVLGAAAATRLGGKYNHD